MGKHLGQYGKRKWKFNGNENLKRKHKSGWSLNRFACCFWLVIHMHPELSKPPVLPSLLFSVGISNTALGSSLTSFPGLLWLQFCILQVIKNWSRGRPGNEVNHPRIKWKQPECNLPHEQAKLTNLTQLCEENIYSSLSNHNSTQWSQQSSVTKQIYEKYVYMKKK